MARRRGAAGFGRHMLEHWLLDPDAVYLNHGTVGATPRRVLQAQQEMRDVIERHPARFMLRELMSLDPVAPAQPTRMRAAAESVATLLGARGDDMVFVDNATAGVNAVLRSLRLHGGDEILILDQAYGAVARTAAYVAREHDARVVTVALPFPIDDESACLRAVEAGITPRTRIAILDHITSETALVLPLAQMAALSREHGVPVLADGAHAPGAIDVDIPALGVDWYVANLHKWAFAPRACGVLWAGPERRDWLHPSVISWGLGVGWHQEFDWTGTRDPTPFLCAPAGIDFMTDFLGVQAMRDYNHALAWSAGQRLCARWGLPWITPERMIGCMATVPLPARLGTNAADASWLRDWLLFEQRIEVPIIARSERLWARVSAQVYNDDEDIDRLGSAVDAYGA